MVHKSYVKFSNNFNLEHKYIQLFTARNTQRGY